MPLREVFDIFFIGILHLLLGKIEEISGMYCKSTAHYVRTKILHMKESVRDGRLMMRKHNNVIQI